jgi:uncharacterized protein (TIGR02449 family)
MDELIRQLEKRIKGLIDQHQGLKQSNHQLNHGKFLLAREKTLLLEKQQKAINQIETLITRLKSIERST